MALTALLFAVWLAQLMTLELSGCRATAQEMLQRAQVMGNPQLQGQALFALANTLFWLGDNHEALANLERRRRAIAGVGHGAGHLGLDIEGVAMMVEALAAFHLGKYKRARAAWGEVLALGTAANPNPFNRVLALQGAAWLACLFGDDARLGALGAELEDVAGAHGFIFYQGIGRVFRGCHLMLDGRHAEAELAMEQGYERDMLCEGGRLFQSFHAWKRGELLLAAGRPLDSERVVTLALDVALEYQERAYLVELLDVRARAWLAQGQAMNAEHELRNALSAAMALGAATARVRVAVHLAEMLAASGRAPEALGILGAALRGVEHDTGIPQLSRALQLLAALGEAITTA